MQYCKETFYALLLMLWVTFIALSKSEAENTSIVLSVYQYSLTLGLRYVIWPNYQQHNT